jgi:hypothetical protein
MKNAICVLLSVFFVIVVSSSMFAQADKEATTTPTKYERIESNYLTGLNSDNHGLEVSSAYFLGEMKSEKAVIPLMKKFRNEKDEGAKLVYAWSLLKIGNSRGVFLVKRETELGDCDAIRSMLQYLYNDHSLKTDGKFD